MAKYRSLFLEEATEHLGEMSGALLELEKDSAATGSIDLVFRMAHSIKSMAASLGFDSISELAHRLEDRMQAIRATGSVSNAEELSLLFRGLEGLEQMVEAVREHGEAPPPRAELVEALANAPAASAAPSSEAAPQKKKSLS
jgi:two-component system chemotaxis sensor kinase CheA